MSLINSLHGSYDMSLSEPAKLGSKSSEHSYTAPKHKQRNSGTKWYSSITLSAMIRFSERELTFTFAICYCPSVCRMSVCLSSVTFVRPTEAVQIFGNTSKALGTLAIRWHPLKISRRSSQGTPPPGELNTRGVAKYSDFGSIGGYISETVQDRR